MRFEPCSKLACTIPAAAKSLGISRRQVYRLIERGTLRKVKAGRRSLVPEADLRAFANGASTGEAVRPVPTVLVTDANVPAILEPVA